MKLELIRTGKADDCTQGRLLIDGEYFCDTIEDRDRGLRDDMPLDEIHRLKVYGETAIPAGTYTVLLTRSVRFQSRPWAARWDGAVPLVANVKGFTGIRIHPANSASELLGCIAVGKAGSGCVTNSASTYDRLMQRIADAGEVTITIR